MGPCNNINRQFVLFFLLFTVHNVADLSSSRNRQEMVLHLVTGLNISDPPHTTTPIYMWACTMKYRGQKGQILTLKL